MPATTRPTICNRSLVMFLSRLPALAKMPTVPFAVWPPSPSSPSWAEVGGGRRGRWPSQPNLATSTVYHQAGRRNRTERGLFRPLFPVFRRARKSSNDGWIERVIFRRAMVWYSDPVRECLSGSLASPSPAGQPVVRGRRERITHHSPSRRAERLRLDSNALMRDKKPKRRSSDEQCHPAKGGPTTDL